MDLKRTVKNTHEHVTKNGGYIRYIFDLLGGRKFLIVVFLNVLFLKFRHDLMGFAMMIETIEATRLPVYQTIFGQILNYVHFYTTMLILFNAAYAGLNVFDKKIEKLAGIVFKKGGSEA